MEMNLIIWPRGPTNLILRLMPPAGLSTSPTLTLLCWEELVRQQRCRDVCQYHHCLWLSLFCCMASQVPHTCIVAYHIWINIYINLISFNFHTFHLLISLTSLLGDAEWTEPTPKLITWTNTYYFNQSLTKVRSADAYIVYIYIIWQSVTQTSLITTQISRGANNID